MTLLEEQSPGTGSPFHPLDHPAWSSLTGTHAHLAEGTPDVRRYPEDVSPIMALRPDPDAGTWEQLRDLVGPGATATFAGMDTPPAGWTIRWSLGGVQMIATDRFRSGPDPTAVTLGADDAEEMLALVARTQPGPFRPRTHEMGTYPRRSACTPPWASTSAARSPSPPSRPPPEPHRPHWVR